MGERKLELIISNNHIVFNQNGKNYLIDTGSPTSFSFDNESSIILGGRVFAFSPVRLCQKQDVDVLSQMDISALIGLDIIQKTNLTIDYKNKKISFECNIDFHNKEYKSFSISLFMGNQAIVTSSISCNNSRLSRCVIDSGAIISYINEEATKKGTMLSETYSDFSPIVGSIGGNLYQTIIEIQDVNGGVHTMPYKVGVLHPLIRQIFDGCIGFNAISQSFIALDFKNNVLIFK